MCAIDATTGSTQTRCGHSFHFGCLATWASKRDTCPLCRAPFTETDSVQRPEPEASILDSVDPFMLEILNDSITRRRRGNIHRYSNTRRVTQVFGTRVEDHINLSSPAGRQFLRQRYEEMIASHPPEHTEPPAVAFVATYGCIPYSTARSYLACHNQDPIETIAYLVHDENDLPIPQFKERDRGGRDESYTSRDIQQRVGLTALTSQSPHGYDGYESR
jgi:hypothetical protein